MTVQEAHDYVKSKRSHILPKTVFLVEISVSYSLTQKGPNTTLGGK